MLESPSVPFREHELWVADVAYVSAERFQQADPDDNIRGAPELVVEALSPSNSAPVTWQSDDEIPVPFGNQAKLPVADILRYSTR